MTTDIIDFVTLATQTEVATISTDYVTATSIIIAATSTQVVSGVFVAHDDSEVYLDGECSTAKPMQGVIVPWY